jgi:hypothetical protein
MSKTKVSARMARIALGSTSLRSGALRPDLSLFQ